MRTARSRRRLRAAVVAAVVLASGLGLVPRPVLGSGAPPIVGRERPVDVASLVPAHARGARAPSGTVRVAETTWTEPRTTCAPIRFTMLGVVWRQRGKTEVPVRLSWGEEPDDLGPATLLHGDPAEGPDPGSPDDRGIDGTPPLWTGEARCVRFSMRLPAGEPIADLRLSFVNTNGTAEEPTLLASAGSAIAGALGSFADAFAPEPAAAMASRPRIITRTQWEADPDWMNCEIEYADEVRMAYVHHTAGSNDYTRAEAAGVVRGIYWYHTHSRGFCDIAYQFLIDRFGRIYEGRSGGIDRPTIGGHAMGFNTRSVGVAAMGNFEDRAVPKRVIRAYKRLLAWRLDVAFVKPTGRAWMTSAGGSTTRYEEGRRVQLDSISGHRDTGYTDCPGRRLYRKLDAIRQGALAIGMPKMWRPAQSRNRLEAVKEAVRWSARLSATLEWTIEITDPEGGTVKTFEGKSDRIVQHWRGRDRLGVPVLPGRYTVKIHGEGPRGGRTRTRVFVVRVDAPVPDEA